MNFTVLVIGDDVDKIMEPYQENNLGTTKEKYLVEMDDGNGGTYMDNPNSFYDYYSLGGRWGGMIQTKDGQDVNQALKKDIDGLGLIISSNIERSAPTVASTSSS